MKKTIKILAVVIALIIAIICVYNFLQGQTYVQGANLQFNDAYTDKLIISASEEHIKKYYKNVYSVDYLQQITSQNMEYNYEATAMAQIRGEEVTFTNYYYGSTDYTIKNETTSQGNTCIENNIIAAIVSGAGVESTGFKYGNEGEYYSSGAQLAIWEFWNTWIENSGAKENGFEKGFGNTTITENELNGQEQRKKAQKLAIQNTYNVNIYFLKYLSHNNSLLSEQDNFGVDNQANLILIEVLDTEEKPTDLEIEGSSDISLQITSNRGDTLVNVGEEFLYTVEVYNKGKEEQQNLILKDVLPEGITFINVVQIVNDFEVELNDGVDYNFNEEERTLTINIDKIDAATTGTRVDETTGETLKYTKLGGRKYKITVKAEELEKGTYIKEVKNVVSVEKENNILTRKQIINTISGACLEIETEELPEKINEKDKCVISLKITNKGLISAENVNVKISIPDEILMNSYKAYLLSDTGEEENVIEGTLTNEFEDNSIQIPEQKTFYIQLVGIVNEIEETKQISIEGTVNEEKIYWTTKVQNQ